jgi:hypothetical protein
MKFSKKKYTTSTLLKVASKQVLLFFLLISFLNTTVFPSLFLTNWQTTNLEQLSTELEGCASLAEFILEDCLDIVDITSDYRKNDSNDIEELSDEINLLNHAEIVISFHTSIYEIKSYRQKKYPLMLCWYHSPTPPPECYI